MDTEKLRETTNLAVEIRISKQQVTETWSPGNNSRLPFAVNVMLNLSINNFVEETLRDLRRCS